MNTDTVEQTEQELIFTRLLAAPREVAFAVFTTSEHLAQWWGPKDWTLPVCTIDFRPGGVWHFCLRSATGQEETWVKAVYREIVKPELIVFTEIFADAQGNVVDELPERLITVTFAEHQGKTKLTICIRYASAAVLQTVLAMGAIQGFKEGWDRLEAYLTRLHGK
ncbi:SRPBCC domain-containing protein [Ktedonosporobacter rubrisoli]|uniref:SRPBCC domain-containing protein n=1 Tax=Ktedonosporobacter rubrisoli TaxID=2509675 RepID=A0A4P6K6H3_KTERU|nr:SRPBCC domain-containing protein [Ktedonosporobacter rubrisoli]QBD83603.1 SRPBCC domain-containing protein [Ktedonosporobacter rubrisoli]